MQSALLICQHIWKKVLFALESVICKNALCHIFDNDADDNETISD